MRQAIVIGAFVLVSTAAVAGWVRKPSAPAPAYPAAYTAPAYQPAASWGVSPGYPAQPYTPLNQYGSPVNQYAAPASQYGTPASQYGSPINAYGAPVSQYTAPVAYAAVPQTTTAVYRRPVVRRVTYVEPRRVVVVRKRKRPFSHSAAIVGGSAGAGAAIGALAGGGKGAGIGALAGGAAGLIYDRLTHNK